MMFMAPTLMSMPSHQAFALTSTATTDASVLADALLGGGASGIDLTSVTATLSGHSTAAGTSSGTYVNPTGTYGIEDGIILSSGNVDDYNDGPNTSTSKTTAYGVAATPAQEALLDPITGGPFSHRDVTQFDISFDMLPGFDTVFFNIVTGSEEWPEFVNSSFIDGFGLYVNGENIAFVDGFPVNINHPNFTDVPGTELDGILSGSDGSFGPHVFTFSAVVGDGAKGNNLTFIVADTTDSSFDTTVWISQLGGSPPGEPGEVCFTEDFDTMVPDTTIVQYTKSGERIIVTVPATGIAASTVPPENFSGVVSIESVQGFSEDGFEDQFLRNTSGGSFGGGSPQATVLILTDLPPHTTVDIGFLLAIIDSWDGSDGSPSPDFFNVAIGEEIIFSETFASASGTGSYDPPDDVLITFKEPRGFNGSWLDSSYDMGQEPTLQQIPHTSDTLGISWFASGAGWQGGIDESWAIDNVEVCINAAGPPPPPSTNNGGDNQWDTRPSFGISHETRQDQIVENGFSFNTEQFTLTDNHWTDFAEQSIEIGMVNTFSATVWADKGLKVQEFLFGIPNVGESHLAEFGVEIWYDINGEIQDVIVVQNSHVIDADTVSVSHEMTKCLATDEEAKCDTTTVSMTFLEPLQDKVMAIKAIDWKNRDQRTYLNEGFDISGESLNPMLAKMIPSTVRDEGLLKVTQVAKYSPYWTTEDGRIFEMNNFGSFKQINQSFERFQDAGTAYTRTHSGFGGIIAYEQNKALDIFDASNLVSELPASFAYIYPETGQRISGEMREAMLLQEQIAKGILDEMDRQDRHY